MKTSNILKTRNLSLHILSVIFLFSFSFSACEREEVEGDPYFMIEGDPTGLSVDRNDNSAKFTVRANRPWQIVAQGEDTWTRAFPDEGDDDGIFSLLVEENSIFEARTMNFAIIFDGEEQAVLFRVDQEANVPYITIPNTESGILVPAAGGAVSIPITANVNWTYSLDSDDWLEELDVTDTELRLYASKNKGDERSVTLTVSSVEFPEVTEEVIISQSAGYILLMEDFSWLTYGSTVPYEWENTVRYDSWTPEEKARGYEVTPNTFTSNEPLCYACYGYVKLGKTNYGGDIIMPSLAIDGSEVIKVTFKSAVYISSSGNIDDRSLKVFALGAGVTSVSEFTINNVPNSLAEDGAGVVNDIWDPAREYSFTITGATSDTRIKFLGGDYDLQGVGQGKNRIFLDDIKVEIIQ